MVVLLRDIWPRPARRPTDPIYAETPVAASADSSGALDDVKVACGRDYSTGVATDGRRGVKAGGIGITKVLVAAGTRGEVSRSSWSLVWR